MAKKILAVDDSKTMRDMINFTLQGAGYDVTLAVDGNDGLTKLKSNEIDLIITDINMPGMNGIDLIKNVRVDDKYRSMPILILTTESGDDLKQEGRSAGATGWIVKPFVPEKLIKVVAKVCP
ncbi:response regulator [Pseudemcibacter aquimaris]|uniref:response regulator n=1 Tax=Pseudemcibacter aquimaris TaxID=2857064 RepID=UPI00201194EC|nr:response regulator [Pseudemcibacter aquimaris]MCC3861223.1 response regulator [Pseudemcibacter aquimaris]WDU57998.1 response regulator [Pseudemcibacter aquimaris]